MTTGAAHPRTIHVSAVLVRRGDGRVLQARKHGARFFLFPGGKPEAGESPAGTASRELAEETGLRLAPEALLPLGHRTTAAANEAGFTLEADIFAVPDGVIADDVLAALVPHAEITELAWVEPADVDPATGEAAAEVIAAAPEAGGRRAQVRLAPLSRSVVASLRPARS